MRTTRIMVGLAVTALALLGATAAMAAHVLEHDVEFLRTVHTDFPPTFTSLFPDGQRQPVRISVTGNMVGEVPRRLFGQLMERTRGDSEETGVEGVWSAEANDWRPNFVSLIEELAPTVIRYPGGMSAERSDWRWGIDRAPGRLTAADLEPGRGRMAQEMAPGVYTTFHVGTDEFLALCERVSAEAWMVVNTAGYRTCPEVGAAIAADWVEYCNAPNDGTNPHGGVDWAAVRAANGHPEPYDVRLWEIGNEVWAWPTFLEPDEYGTIARVYAEAMLEVDPDLGLIGMANGGDWARASLEAFGPNLRYLATNFYSPWRIEQEDLTLSDVWQALMSGPPTYFLEAIDEAKAAIEASGRTGDVHLAVSEWNINLFYGTSPFPPRTPNMMMVGAAVLLHDLMRRSDDIDLAAMSVLVGSTWEIAVIRCDDLIGTLTVYPRPLHTLMALYRARHGEQRLAIEMTDCPQIGPNQRVGNIPARDPVPALNVIATRSETAVFLHIINGAPADAISVVIDATEADALRDAPVERCEIYHENSLWIVPPDDAPPLTVTERDAEDGELALTLPPHSVTVLEWPRPVDESGIGD